jgi:glycogen(starch) synthase
MRLLFVTNLYPPQELGGYGRCMSDFAWALKQLGHHVEVLTSDAPYLGRSGSHGPSGEPVHRRLRLKGNYNGGVHTLQSSELRKKLDLGNRRVIMGVWHELGPFDGAIVGNIDLLGLEVVHMLLTWKVPVLHHIGFINPPFTAELVPTSRFYHLVAASRAVGTSLLEAGLSTEPIPVVYPGVRCDLFGFAATKRLLPFDLENHGFGKHLGSPQRPLKVCFAGLLMSSKGAHTLIEALILLKDQGITVTGFFAGAAFQDGYRERMQKMLNENDLDLVSFVGQMPRTKLARLFRLHHVCVFPSIHPEAFGIVAAEAMASGLALISSGVGGSSEIFADGTEGLRFNAGDAYDLAKKLAWMCKNPGRMAEIAKQGEMRSRVEFDVIKSGKKLEGMLQRFV